jgi:hypothetical protein
MVFGCINVASLLGCPSILLYQFLEREFVVNGDNEYIELSSDMSDREMAHEVGESLGTADAAAAAAD